MKKPIKIITTTAGIIIIIISFLLLSALIFEADKLDNPFTLIAPCIALIVFIFSIISLIYCVSLWEKEKLKDKFFYISVSIFVASVFLFPVAKYINKFLNVNLKNETNLSSYSEKIGAGIIFLFALLVFVLWKTYEILYFKSQEFLRLKERTCTYINDLNELNHHIEWLKNSQIRIDHLDYGKSTYYDKSVWNVKRPELKKQKYDYNIYNCSLSICDGARKAPFKYICKYFNIDENEKNLEKFEFILNNFEAAEEGKLTLKKERENILFSVNTDIPFLIRLFSKKKIESQFGLETIDFSTLYFPRYVFKYISPGGNTSTQCDIIMDIENLNKFIEYLSKRINIQKSMAAQRALMTSKLRERIKQRDNFTCQRCGISVIQEPNLLLEIDHIIPISKGGITTEDNLQTLCWRCNRSKGAKIGND